MSELEFKFPGRHSESSFKSRIQCKEFELSASTGDRSLGNEVIATKIHSLWLNQASMAKMKGSIRKPVKNTSRISIFTIYMVGSFVSGCLSSKQFTHFVVQISQRLFFLLECAWCSFCDLILQPPNPPFVCKSAFF